MTNSDWITDPPEDIESIVGLLDTFGDAIDEDTPKGETLRFLLKQARAEYERASQNLRANEPQAFVKPSYEQALLLNCWIFGFNFPICFSANRIGKTFAMTFNGILWIFPNNPQWVCFQTYEDYLGRPVTVYERPPLQNMIEIQKFYEEHPHLQGNPQLPPTHPDNFPKFKEVLKRIPDLFTPAWPKPPIQKGGQIWLGAPDNEFHKRIIMRIWRRLLPKSSILKDSESDRMFVISTASSTNPKTTAHEIVCKSYESEETKWSGDAVTGIILTEGFTQDILNEIKNRVINEGFASWDYTPAEPRNTGKKVHLAYKVYKHEEELPLRPYVFMNFSVRTAPEHIIPKQKKDDLIRMWEGKKEGEARLEGKFFASSGLVLDKLDRSFHCLNWTLKQLYEKYPNGRRYRGFDPGFDHPAACAWGYLTTGNIWFIYRFYSKRGTTIAERCKDIIELSGNRREQYQSRNNQILWREVHPSPDSEIFVATIADYHTFKTDEITGTDFSLNYAREGLTLIPSTHMRPEERVSRTNNLLDPAASAFLAHPERNVAPGARIFFLTSQPGVAAALDKFEQIFWDRYKSGEHAGEPKDTVPIHGDDELDALDNLVCGPYIWTQHEGRRREPQEVATLQHRSRRQQTSLILPPEPQPIGFM